MSNLITCHLNRKFAVVKKAFYSLAVLGFLTTLTNCGCANPTGPRINNPTNTVTVQTNATDIRVDKNVIFYPENTIALSVTIDINVLEALYLKFDSNFTSNDVSITMAVGADAVVNLSGLTLVGHTVTGNLKLDQRFDFETPIDNNRDNDYEIADFNILVNNSSTNFVLISNYVSNIQVSNYNSNIQVSNSSTNFVLSSNYSINYKLILRIIDLVAEPSKLEILIDSFHLSPNTSLRGIKELYFYETTFVANHRIKDDPKNFLLSNLIANSSIIGTEYPGSDIGKLYDKDDTNDAFMTAINNSSNAYHRLIFEFNEAVNLQKVAIRGRQMGGYEGFYFIIKDANNNILSVHRATGSAARGRGSDPSAVSTYSFVPDYNNPITNVGIRMNNSFFGIDENTTNVILTDNFSVISGYEYERGIVKFSRPGPDIDKFNTNNVFFFNNKVFFLSFLDPPNAEHAIDADANNLYEVGSVTISNVDGGHINFNLTVEVVNIVDSTIRILRNAVSYRVKTEQFTIVSNLIDASGARIFENGIDAGQATFVNYELSGDDAYFFRIENNRLKTVNPYGFDPFSGKSQYQLDVGYISEVGGDATKASVTVYINSNWNKVTDQAPWTSRGGHQSLVLSDGTILVIGGYTGDYQSKDYQTDVWGSSDGGKSWYLVSASSSANRIALSRGGFQAVVLPNDDILVMGGYAVTNEGFVTKNLFNTDRSTNDIINADISWNSESIITNDIWRSSDRGVSWQNISSANDRWTPRFDFQAVVLPNNDILVMGGHLGSSLANDIWRSSDGGRSWIQMTASATWSVRSSFQTLNLGNGDLLVMGGYVAFNNYRNDIWRSSDGGTSWNEIPVTSAIWSNRHGFQALALPNDRILVLGGFVESGYIPGGFSVNDIWLSTNNGTNWNFIIWQLFSTITDTTTGERTSIFNWHDRYDFQAIITKNNVLIMGGQYYKIKWLTLTDGSQRLDNPLIPIELESGVRNDVWRIGPIDPSLPAN